jgi:hypothetical protein
MKITDLACQRFIEQTTERVNRWPLWKRLSAKLMARIYNERAGSAAPENGGK